MIILFKFLQNQNSNSSAFNLLKSLGYYDTGFLDSVDNGFSKQHGSWISMNGKVFNGHLILNSAKIANQIFCIFASWLRGCQETPY